MNFENGGIALALTESRPQKKLPYKVLEGLNSVMSLTELKLGPRNTLKTLLSYLSKHSVAGEVYVRRGKIADRAGISVASVNRHISQLRNMGILTVGEQGRIQTPGRRYGDFTVTHIFFTQSFLKQIGWITENTKAQDDQTSTETRAQEAHVAADTSLKMSAPIYKKLTKPSIDTQKDQGGRPTPKVPVDLLPLVERDVWPKTICKLMGIAKAKGHWLTHVWNSIQATTDRLGLTGNRLKGYLEKTIANGGDFAKRAAKAIEAREHAARVAADQVIIRAFREQFSGKTLSSPDGRIRMRIDSDGSLAHRIIGAREDIVPLTNRRDIEILTSKIDQGELVEGLVLQVTSLQETMSAARSSSEIRKTEFAKIRDLMKERRTAALAAAC